MQAIHAMSIHNYVTTSSKLHISPAKALLSYTVALSTAVNSGSEAITTKLTLGVCDLKVETLAAA
jgi:hypothetical protein